MKQKRQNFCFASLALSHERTCFHLIPKRLFGNVITRENLFLYNEAELFKFFPSQAPAWDGGKVIL